MGKAKPGSPAHIQNDLGKHLGAEHQIIQNSELVRLVHPVVHAGHGAAEGHAAGDVVDIGAPPMARHRAGRPV